MKHLFCIIGLIVVISGCENKGSRNDITSPNIPNYPVDLGLSVKWSNVNLGSKAPEQIGDKFALGELVPRLSENETFPNGFFKTSSEWLERDSLPDFPPKDREMSEFEAMIWNERGCGIVKSEFDAARQILGGTWRIPTDEEARELVEKCEWRWINYNGTDGYRVEGPNGNSIFLPVQMMEDGVEYGSIRTSYVWDGGASDFIAFTKPKNLDKPVADSEEMQGDGDYGFSTLGVHVPLSIRPVTE